MSEEPNAPVEQPSTPVAAETPKKDSVSYDTHRKLLDEKKSLQSHALELEQKLSEFQQSVEEKQKQELEAQNRFKELYEQAKQESERLASTLTERDKQMQDALKIDAFNKSLGDKAIDRKYSGFIDTSKILIDPSSGAVDELSAQKEVERIMSEFPEIVRSSAPARSMPNAAPQGASSVGKPSLKDNLANLAKALERKRHL